MKERPILFSGPMVRAILEKRKTQTRRVIKPQPEAWAHDMVGWELAMPNCRPLYPDSFARSYCPYGQPGDRLWVRETWTIPDPTDKRTVCYRSSNDPITTGEKWKPSIYMPRWASRITLEITGVRVERLQDISESDAKAEGCPHYETPDGTCSYWFREYLKKHGHMEWDANPWVWVVEFKRV